MGALLLLGLLSGALVLSAFDNDDPETQDAPDMPEPVPGEEITSEIDGDEISGTAGNDTITASGDDVEVLADAGDDNVRLTGADVQLDGNDGNDTLTALGGATVFGGDGDDSIRIGNGVVFGEEGDDRILQLDPSANSTLDGGAGNDTIAATGSESQIFGGTGDDALSVTAAGGQAFGGEGNDHFESAAGTRAFGEAGDDTFALNPGAFADGGAGDDLIVANLGDQIGSPDEQTEIFAGEGADTIDVVVIGSNETDAIQPNVLITDFNPNEDVFQLSGQEYQGVDLDVAEVTIEEAGDGSYSDIRVAYTNPNIPGSEAGSILIRIEGVTGLTPDQFVIAD